MGNNGIRKEILDIIRKGEGDFLITSHVNPDGDAIGSMGAMFYLLKSMGKRAYLYNESGIPQRFEWLDFAPLVDKEVFHKSYFCVIYLDCGDKERAGDRLKDIETEVVINIDHHPTNTLFGDKNWVDPSLSSVGEMVAYFVRDLGLRLKGPLAEAIYTAIVSDTGGFTFSNTSARTLDVVADILREGFDLDSFNRNYQRCWSLNRVHLHGRAMQGAEVRCNGEVGIIAVPASLMEETHTTPQDCEGIINYVRQIKGVKIAIMLREEGEGRVKFSLRSWGEVDVSRIAVKLGGGGHKNASGGTLSCSLHRSLDIILQEVKGYL